MFDNKEKSVNEFAKLIGKMDAPSFIGIATLLKVELFYPETKDEKGLPLPRSAEAIIEDSLVKFYGLNRQKRRELLQLAREAAKGKKDGTTTRH